MTSTLEVVMVKVDDVTAAPWNVNVMGDDERLVLRQGMKASPPEKCDPIHIATLEDGKTYTTDGAQRLDEARRLNWTKIPAVFHPEIKTEEQARLFNFQRDYARGTIDQYRLAATFRWLVDEQHRTQGQVADAYGFSQGEVSRILSLLNLTPNVLKQVRSDTAFKNVSSVQPIAALDKELQETALALVKKEAPRGRALTSREVEEVALRVKTEDQERKKFLAAVDSSKFPNCPKDSTKAVQATYSGLPWVTCRPGERFPDHEHEWSLTTGKSWAQLEDEARHQSRSEAASKAQSGPDQFVRTTHTADEFLGAFAGYVREVVPSLVELDDVELSGKTKDGEKVSVSVDTWGGSGTVNFSATVGRKTVSFTVEPKKYATDALKDFHAVVSGGNIKTEAQLKDLEERALGFLREYGPKSGGRAK